MFPWYTILIQRHHIAIESANIVTTLLVQTSVSQRPLTAKKRGLQAADAQVYGRHQVNGIISNSTAPSHPNSMAAAGSLSGTAGRTAASSIPAFRTAANSSQLTQRKNQETNHHQAGSGHASQSAGPPVSCTRPCAQPRPQQGNTTLPEEITVGTAQQGDSMSAHHRNAAQLTRSNEREGSSYDRQGFSHERQGSSFEREGSSMIAGALHSVQQQADDPDYSQSRSVPPQGASRAAPWLPDQQYAEQTHDRHKSATQDTITTGQAAAVAAAAKPVMYVKPPWAIDDPYQVRWHSLHLATG